MRILAVADEESKYFYDHYSPGKLDEFDLILACGDLRKEYLEFLATLAHCPVLYVHGNHDDSFDAAPPGGCICVEDQIYTYRGIRILGLGGSYRYRDGTHLYILMTHAPARHINDFDSLPHRGFVCFTDLLEQYRPKYFVHGHIHRSYGPNIPQRSSHGDTTTINASGYYVFEY